MKSGTLAVVALAVCGAACASKLSYTGMLLRAMDAYADTITEEMNKGSFIPDARARAANEIRTSLFALREFKKVIDD